MEAVQTSPRMDVTAKQAECSQNMLSEWNRCNFVYWTRFTIVPLAMALMKWDHFSFMKWDHFSFMKWYHFLFMKWDHFLSWNETIFLSWYYTIFHSSNKTIFHWWNETIFHWWMRPFFIREMRPFFSTTIRLHRRYRSFSFRIILCREIQWDDMIPLSQVLMYRMREQP